MNIEPLKAAQLLIVGYEKCWGMQTLLANLGVPSVELDPAAIHDHLPFMPDNLRDYYATTPVRAIVEREWPRLATYLDANRGKPDMLLKAAPQILKLAYRGERRSTLDKGEQKEIYKTRRDLRRATTEKGGDMQAYGSNLRGAWNVCKK